MAISTRWDPSDTAGPLSLDGGSPFEFQAEIGEKRDRGIERFDNDAYVIQPLETHPAPSLPDTGIGTHLAFNVCSPERGSRHRRL